MRGERLPQDERGLRHHERGPAVGRTAPDRDQGACLTRLWDGTSHPNERRVARDKSDYYWLYVVTNCADAAELQEPIRDPARLPWSEVRKVKHYYMSVGALTGERDGW